MAQWNSGDITPFFTLWNSGDIVEFGGHNTVFHTVEFGGHNTVFSHWGLSRLPWSSLAQVPAGQPLNGRYKGSVSRGSPRPRCLSKLLHRTVFR